VAAMTRRRTNRERGWRHEARGLAWAWLALLLLMLVSLGSAYLKLGAGNVVAGIAIAIVKAGIVVWWFMQLRRASAMTRIAAAARHRLRGAGVPRGQQRAAHGPALPQRRAGDRGLHGHHVGRRARARAGPRARAAACRPLHRRRGGRAGGVPAASRLRAPVAGA